MNMMSVCMYGRYYRSGTTIVIGEKKKVRYYVNMYVAFVPGVGPQRMDRHLNLGWASLRVFPGLFLLPGQLSRNTRRSPFSPVVHDSHRRLGAPVRPNRVNPVSVAHKTGTGWWRDVPCWLTLLLDDDAPWYGAVHLLLHRHGLILLVTHPGDGDAVVNETDAVPGPEVI